MAINSTASNHKLKIKLPFYAKSGTHLLSTGNLKSQLCQASDIAMAEPLTETLVEMPANSLNTYIFMIDHEATDINAMQQPEDEKPVAYYDLLGRRIDKPQGFCIEKYADGYSRKVYINE
jgi:glucuronoarabinoxylan endo-1,4-beta-xylanase